MTLAKASGSYVTSTSSCGHWLRRSIRVTSPLEAWRRTSRIRVIVWSSSKYQSEAAVVMS